MLYSNSAFGPPYKNIARLSTQIEPNYLFGSRDYKTQPFLFTIDHVSVTSNVATITGSLKSGGGSSPNNVPAVGAKMGVRGTTTNSGIFNVDPATVTAVTFTAATGAVSVSFALTHADVGSTADTGELVIQSAELFDIVAAGTASAPVALVFTPDESDNSRSLFATARWTGTLPSAATVVLQVANVDDDAQYVTVKNSQGNVAGASVAASDNIAVIAGSAVTQSGALYQFVMGKFIRAKVLTATGADGTTGLIVTLFG